MSPEAERPKHAAPWGRDPADLAWAALALAVVVVLVTRNHLLGLTRIPSLELGPLTLNVFGPLMALDILFGFHLVRRWCLRFGLDWPAFARGLPWIVIGGYLISHWVAVALYYPELLGDAAALLDPRGMISSFGGMFGGGLLAVLHLRRAGLPVWLHMDALVAGFVGGYVFGRAGCFAIHDHPGRATDFVLGIRIEGVARHDLGFYEMLLMIALLIVLLGLSATRRPPAGLPTAVALTLYAPIRFALDSLRIADPRYAGLTPGQWFCFPMLAIAAWAWWRLVRSGGGDPLGRQT
jgi:phosphatidylglycerol:prolipoprotein diacylglycerol transferase